MIILPSNSKCRKAFCFEFCFLNLACFICFYNSAVLFSHIDYRSYFAVFFYKVHYRNAKFFCFCVFLTCFFFLCIHLYCIGFFYFFRSSCILVFHGNLNFSIFRIDLFACAVQEVDIVCKEACDGIFFILSFFFKSGCYIFILFIFALNWSYNKLCIFWKNILCSCCSHNHIFNCLRVGYFVFDLNVCFFFICIFVFCTLLFSLNNFRHIASYISFCFFVGNFVPGEFVFISYCFEKWKLSVCSYCCDHFGFCGRSYAKVNFVCGDADHFDLFLIWCFFRILFFLRVFYIILCVGFFSVLFGIFGVGVCIYFFVIYFTIFFFILIVFIIICCRCAAPYKCECCGSC